MPYCHTKFLKSFWKVNLCNHLWLRKCSFFNLMKIYVFKKHFSFHCYNPFYLFIILHCADLIEISFGVNNFNYKTVYISLLYMWNLMWLFELYLLSWLKLINFIYNICSIFEHICFMIFVHKYMFAVNFEPNHIWVEWTLKKLSR